MRSSARSCATQSLKAESPCEFFTAQEISKSDGEGATDFRLTQSGEGNAYDSGSGFAGKTFPCRIPACAPDNVWRDRIEPFSARIKFVQGTRAESALPPRHSSFLRPTRAHFWASELSTILRRQKQGFWAGRGFWAGYKAQVNSSIYAEAGLLTTMLGDSRHEQRMLTSEGTARSPSSPILSGEAALLSDGQDNQARL